MKIKKSTCTLFSAFLLPLTLIAEIKVEKSSKPPDNMTKEEKEKKKERYIEAILNLEGSLEKVKVPSRSVLKKLDIKQLKALANKLAEQYAKENFDRKRAGKTIKDIYEKVMKEEPSSPLARTQFISFAQEIKKMSEHPLLEKETKIRKAWFVNLAKCLSAMIKPHKEMKRAILTKNKEKYLKAWKKQQKLAALYEKVYKAKNKYKVKKKKKKGGIR